MPSSAHACVWPIGLPSSVFVKVVVIIVVALVTVVLTTLGSTPSTALAVIVMVTTTAMDIAGRITASDEKRRR
ncbi:hypothetical protein [Streptomyces sp. Cmuel-A718b]|uniref:hypothetical protein n=1 Tax=Streptomyces sp. Cmuel-A718b TaxID=697328 RepID=UPI00081EA6DC|nr:hypothetical protein [Streptomyces sp. Cmuel-A718b]SCF59717.1 hypothetical protein GA0115280_102815 [Streptomyces sp. Cmuel-A718b]